MKRSRVHLAFALATLLPAAWVGWQAWQWQQARQLNRVVADGASSTGDSAGIATGILPEAEFARALALQQAGQMEPALKAYQRLIDGPRADLRQAALYNQGNLQLRAALKDGAANAIHSLPLIELAKQSFRDLLREHPDDWDARHNLELALWLAPEADEVVEQAKETRVHDVRESRFLPGSRLSLP